MDPENIQLPPDCEMVIRALWDYLDGRVDPDASTEIEDHLEQCASCGSHIEFERRLVHEISRLRREYSSSGAQLADAYTRFYVGAYATGSVDHPQTAARVSGVGKRRRETAPHPWFPPVGES